MVGWRAVAYIIQVTGDTDINQEDFMKNVKFKQDLEIKVRRYGERNAGSLVWGSGKKIGAVL